MKKERGTPLSQNPKYPSKHLNEKSIFLGLSYLDISGLGSFLIILIVSLSPLKSDISSYLSLIITFFAGIILIPIRLTKRRKTIRDSVKFLFQKRVIK